MTRHQTATTASTDESARRVDRERTHRDALSASGRATRTEDGRSADSDRPARSAFDSTVEHVPRLSGAVWIGLGLAAVGIATRTPVLVVGATIPLWYLAYAAVAGMGEVEVAVARECPRVVTEAGERVSVELVVENVGSDPISDLRVVDGVPEELSVVEGSPRACLALGPGERATVEYEIETRRGGHRFEAPTLRARNLVGTVVETGEVDAAGTEEIVCELPVEAVPLDGRTSHRAGRVTADEGGSGVEFRSVREYQRGDPIRSIDWRRYARSGDLTTVEYRAERAATVGIVVDARPETYVAPGPDATTAAATTAYAAERTLERLADAGAPTCLLPATRKVEAPIGPGTDTETIQRARGRLEELRSGEPTGAVRASIYSGAWSVEPADVADAALDRLPDGATVLVFSPALDEFPANLCRGLARRGFDVTLVSPDVTDGDDPIVGVRRVQRADRLDSLQSERVGVVDWDRDLPLGSALGAALAGGDGL
ncbi:DUF58 domain-containing protein [Natronoarchaeum rubrum]|uniref:DUF58 domain-containing protein n=1 Tax=Natronoarchaeum rubrum TaxID=755311 RepID=UPI002111CA72|nr:DUF58 domain-containing protein [Natronoarchaeum rubrum]